MERGTVKIFMYVICGIQIDQSRWSAKRFKISLQEFQIIPILQTSNKEKEETCKLEGQATETKTGLLVI